MLYIFRGKNVVVQERTDFIQYLNMFERGRKLTKWVLSESCSAIVKVNGDFKMAAPGLVWLAVSCFLLGPAGGAGGGGGNTDIRVVETPVRRKTPGKWAIFCVKKSTVYQFAQYSKYRVFLGSLIIINKITAQITQLLPKANFLVQI